MSNTKFKIVSCQESSLAFTNYVYIHPDNKGLLKSKNKNENWLSIGKFVFNVEAHTKINIGEIGLSKVQRKTINLELNDLVHIIRWRPAKDGSSNLISAKLFLELAQGTRVKLKEDDIVEIILNIYSSHVLTKGQILMIN